MRSRSAPPIAAVVEVLLLSSHTVTTLWVSESLIELHWDQGHSMASLGLDGFLDNLSLSEADSVVLGGQDHSIRLGAWW